MALPSLCPRCEELEDQVAALKGTAGSIGRFGRRFSTCWPTYLAPVGAARPMRFGTTVRAQTRCAGIILTLRVACARRAGLPSLACFGCHGAMATLGRSAAACYLELVGRSAIAPWRDPEL